MSSASPSQNQPDLLLQQLLEHQQATETRERLAAIVESSDDAIISKSLQGIIMSWNRGAERLFGYTAEEAVGQHISMLAVPERIDEIPQILARITRGERIDHYETKRRAKDGRVLIVSLTVSPLRDSFGVVVGASKIARDVTERERQRLALEKANMALTRANADLQHFAYSASHDLQEPLRMVSTYSQMLQKKFDGQLGEIGDQCIRYTVEGAERMRKLLDDLLAFTRASTEEGSAPEAIDANAALDAALTRLQGAIAESGAIITRTSLPMVCLYQFQLEQLFQNLIGNAIHYRSEKHPQIDVAAERDGDQWLFSIRDNGIGIAPEYQAQIFEMFKRLHSAADYSGSGMGLAICQRVVERTGGRIWVESELGHGSTFFFTLPG